MTHHQTPHQPPSFSLRPQHPRLFRSGNERRPRLFVGAATIQGGNTRHTCRHVRRAANFWPFVKEEPPGQEGVRYLPGYVAPKKHCDRLTPPTALLHAGQRQIGGVVA